jgi:signal transduction histidine kinase
MDDDQRRAHERSLAELGEQTATVVHEIRNPLTTITMLLDYIEMTGATSKARHMLSGVRAEVRRVERMLEDLLASVRAPALVRKRLDLGALAASVVLGMGPMADRVELLLDDVRVDGDEERLRQVITNLLRNALEATTTERVLCSVRPDGTCAVLCVVNGGAPIPPEALARVFQPFFTTKRRGTGLGLPLVRRLVEAHGGTIELQSSVEEGTRAIVRLPPARIDRQSEADGDLDPHG